MTSQVNPLDNPDILNNLIQGIVDNQWITADFQSVKKDNRVIRWFKSLLRLITFHAYKPYAKINAFEIIKKIDDLASRSNVGLIQREQAARLLESLKEKKVSRREEFESKVSALISKIESLNHADVLRNAQRDPRSADEVATDQLIDEQSIADLKALKSKIEQKKTFKGIDRLIQSFNLDIRIESNNEEEVEDMEEFLPESRPFIEIVVNNEEEVEDMEVFLPESRPFIEIVVNNEEFIPVPEDTDKKVEPDQANESKPDKPIPVRNAALLDEIRKGKKLKPVRVAPLVGRASKKSAGKSEPVNKGDFLGELSGAIHKPKSGSNGVRRARNLDDIHSQASKDMGPTEDLKKAFQKVLKKG